MTQTEYIELVKNALIEGKLSVEEIVDKYTECSTPELRARLIFGLKKLKKEWLNVLNK